MERLDTNALNSHELNKPFNHILHRENRGLQRNSVRITRTLVAVFAALRVFAQGAPDDAQVLKTFQNPVGDLISVQFQNYINFPWVTKGRMIERDPPSGPISALTDGPYGRIHDVLNIQPVVPIHVSQGWLIISRWITPVVYQPGLGFACWTSGFAARVICESRETQNLPPSNSLPSRLAVASIGQFHSTSTPRRASASPRAGTPGLFVPYHQNGLGDLSPSFLLSPAHPGKLVWSVGPTFLLPTATDSTLGQGKWAAGPTIVLTIQPKHWTVGVLATNIWSFAGNEGRPPVNQLVAQYFVTRNFEHSWFLTSQPFIIAFWHAKDHNKWIVPFGGGVGKMTRFFGQRMVWQMQLYYNAVNPQDSPSSKWQVRTEVSLLFPPVIK
jgi:hypothetical protein